MSRNIKLVLEYDGTNYHGWQAQVGTGRPTIQETLEQAIRVLTKEECTTFSSGRTDARVHAFGHAANFMTRSLIPGDAWAPALNHLLPPDIRVLTSEDMPRDFHARYSALSKLYKYRILNRQAPSALYRNYAWHFPGRLDLAAMSRGGACLIGKHDFSAFRGAGCGSQTPVRTVKRVEIEKIDDFIELWVEADAFLQYMVRNIAGTLVEVGRGRFTPDDVTRILASQDRSRAGRTAPPQGLYLIAVFYPEEKKK